MVAGPRDENSVVVLMGVSSSDGVTPVTVYVDPTTHRLLVSSSSTAAGNDTEVQYNDGGAFAGDAGMTYNATTNVLTLAGGIIIGSSNPFSDSSGTLTLQNIDALDATTEATIEAAIDTLANLVSIQGHTVTLTGDFIRSGAHSLTLTTSGPTNVILPTSGTLVNSAVTSLPSLGTVSTALTGVLRADSGVLSVDSDVTDIVSAASDSAAGKVELATIAETDTGTDTARAVTPDGLAGSVFGEKATSILVINPTTDCTTGDGKTYITIPSSLNGMNLVEVAANVITAGTTNTMDIQIRNVTQTADMLSTKITIDSGETSSSTAATPAVIDGANDDVATGDVIAVDIDAVHTTAAKGLIVNLIFRLP